MREMRRKLQIIFQDPYASLNPRMTIGGILSEPMEIHGLAQGKEARQKRLYELLDQVQLPKDALNKYPHEFSGGKDNVFVLHVHWLSSLNLSFVTSQSQL